MNSPDVAAALHAGAPDAAGQLYDAHAEALFQYSWLTLRNRRHAHTAVCDALVQARARVAELSDPATLRAWLFALVQAECHYHPLPSLGDTDEPIARPQQPDAALRIMAWNSVMSLDLLQRQALDLATRHGMTEPEVGLILGLPLAGATELLGTGRRHLARALGAEILVSRDSRECPGRAEAIHGWTGIVTPEFRERLLAHAGSCAVCQPKLPRNVSAGRIFGLLPAPSLDREARSWVIGRVSDLVRSRADEPESEVPAPVRPVSAMPEPGPVVPDPVVPDPAVPDPALPDPVVPDPSASPGIIRERFARGETVTPAETVAPSETAATSGPAAASAPSAAPASPKRGRQPQPQPQRRRRPDPRVFAGVGAAVAAIAAGLAVGSMGGHTRLSGSDSRLVTGTTPSQTGTGTPIPRPDAPPSIPGHQGQKHVKTTAISPSAAGGADSVASGKQAGAGTRGASRTVTVPRQVTHRSVTVTLPPSSQPARPGPAARTSASAQLTVSPASMNLGDGTSGSLTLTASGGSVSWTAASSSASVTLSQESGQLGNGDSVPVTVSVQRQSGSGGSATVSINGALVSVSWAATERASSAPSSAPSGAPPGAPGQRHHRPQPGGSPDAGAS